MTVGVSSTDIESFSLTMNIASTQILELRDINTHGVITVCSRLHGKDDETLENEHVDSLSAAILANVFPSLAGVALQSAPRTHLENVVSSANDFQLDVSREAPSDCVTKGENRDEKYDDDETNVARLDFQSLRKKIFVLLVVLEVLLTFLPQGLSSGLKLLTEKRPSAAQEYNILQRKVKKQSSLRLGAVEGNSLSGMSFGVIDERKFDTDEKINQPSSRCSEGIM